MKIIRLNNFAFSLLEVLLAAIIFVVTIGGVFVALNAIRVPVLQKERALTATVFGKQVLEDLRSQVNAANYYNACSPSPCANFSLALGQHQVPVGNFPQGLSWPPILTQSNPVLSYKVSCADTGSTTTCGPETARRVDLNINWPEPS